MASYTMQLREYIEQATQYENLSTREKIEKGRTKLFDFDYPIFDENYRKVFETHFIRKFYMREIGFETEGLFKFQLETWLSINMPYFNKLFESELMDYDPFINSKMEASHTKKVDKDQNDNRNTNGTTNTGVNKSINTNEDNTSNLVNNNFVRDLESNNPDSRLSITTNDGEGVIQYASKIDESSINTNQNVNGNTMVNGNESTDADTQTSNTDNFNSAINETEDYVQSRTGKIGVQSYSKMLMEYRDALIRIENKIFDEMQELFMLVY